MVCAGCGFDAPPDFAFCPKCGTKFSAVAAVPPPAPVERAARPAAGTAESDRRPVTVLFADLSGFTALSEQLDPEDVRAFQGDLFRELAEAVERYEGFVEKFVGDAVMAVFGAPVAHDDDPERGLHAALSMQERMGALNRRWARRLGRSLELHVGLNTGPVVAGRIGATADAAYAVTGDTVNTASRLQSAAEAGEVLVSEATRRLTEHAFAFAPRGALSLKGKREPVAAFRVLGALDAPRARRGLESVGLAAPLTGRDGELERMREAFDRMRVGGAQVLSLIGEPGAGKSRLVRELLSRLEADGELAGVTVRRAACSALGEQPYGVVAALLRDAYGIEAGDSLEIARAKLASGLGALGVGGEAGAQLAALLSRLFGLEPDPGWMRHLDPEQLKRQIAVAMRILVERRLDESALVLAVEDAHWADAASVELMGELADRLADRPLMLLLAYRPALDPSALGVTCAEHTAIRLEPLSSGAASDLLSAWFGAAERGVPERLRALIIERAGGNPLYLEEIVRTLIAEGALARGDDGWRTPVDVGAMQVPTTLHGIMLARLDRLDAAARRAIQEAAVIGPAFDPELLRAIAAEPAGLDAALETLTQAELLAPGPGYGFRQGLVQEVVYENLLVGRRTQIHTRIGQALEARTADQPRRLEVLEALGHHFSRSSEPLHGARYLIAAGDWARGMYANADAATHYRRALDTLGRCDGAARERLSTRERLADLLGPMGEREAAIAHYEEIEAGYREEGEVPGQARVQRKMGALYWGAGDRPRARECFEAGLALLADHPEDIEGAHLCQEMGRLAFRSGDNQLAIEWAERAIAHAGRLAAEPSSGAEARAEAAAAAAHGYNTLGAALARLGRTEEAARHIEQSVELAEAHGLLQAVCRGLANLGVLYSTADPGRAIETCTTGLETAKRIGDLGFQSRLYANLAVAYCALTNRCDDDGIGAARAAIELDRRLGQLDHLAVPLIVLGQIYQCHGEPERAIAHYREALALAERAGEPQLLFPCYDGLATVYLDAGDDREAEHYMQKAQEVCADAGLEPDALVVLPFLD